MKEELLKELGIELTKERVKKKYSLEKLSEITKISLLHLQSIEEGRFDKLPGKFYEKSFLNMYLKTLKIKNSKFIDLYKQAYLKDEPVSVEKDKIQDSEENHNTFLINLINKKIPSMAFLSFCIVGFLLITFYSFFQKENENSLALIEPKIENNLKRVEDLNENVNVDDLKSRNEDPIQNTNLDAELGYLELQEPLQNSNIVEIDEILAVDDVWIEIRDENEQSIIATLLKRDETFRLPEEKGLTITASNAGVLKIKKGNELSTELGSFGTVLEKVSLDSLLNKY